MGRIKTKPDASSGAQWQDKRQQAQREIWEILLKEKKKFFSVWTIKQCMKYLRQVVEPSSLEILETQLSNSPSKLAVADTAWAGAWTKWLPETPANLWDSVTWICDKNVYQSTFHGKF